MRTLEVLPIVWPGVVAGLAAALLCGALSPLVVARKMAFATQGVSHAAMLGAGVAALAGLTGTGASAAIAAACLLAALAIGLITARRAAAPDTAVGVVLVASMAAGAIMIAWRLDHPIPGAARPPAWESLLFGSMLLVRPVDAYAAAAVASAGLAAAWLGRRALLATTIDPLAARAAGVDEGRAAIAMALLVGAAVVIAVKVVGVVLGTALLVLPGAGAVRLSRRLGRTFGLSALAALGGIVAGLIVSFETDAPPGASAALALTLWWALAALTPPRRRAQGGDHA